MVRQLGVRETLYGAFEVKYRFHGIFIFLYPSFFVRSQSLFLRPDPQYRKAGARRGCQGRRFFSAAVGLSLTGPSTTALSMRSG